MQVKYCDLCKEQIATICIEGRYKICDRCAEELKIEEQKQHEQMRGWDYD